MVGFKAAYTDNPFHYTRRVRWPLDQISNAQDFL
jgi:hypothetical protein